MELEFNCSKHTRKKNIYIFRKGKNDALTILLWHKKKISESKYIPVTCLKRSQTDVIIAKHIWMDSIGLYKMVCIHLLEYLVCIVRVLKTTREAH